jgi:hypothetical protein
MKYEELNRNISVVGALHLLLFHMLEETKTFDYL